MNADINLLCKIANVVVTISCGGTILYLVCYKKIERHLFYYGWSIGFILYGTQILLRTFSPSDPNTQIPMILAFIIFPISTWSLSRRKDVILLLIPILVSLISLSVLFFTGMIRGPLTWLDRFSQTVGSLFFYIPVTITVIIHRRMFGNCVDRLIIGWLLLSITNLLLPLDNFITNILAIFSKIVILNGLVTYDFAIITHKIRQEMASRVLPITTGYRREGGLKLVTLKSKGELPLTIVSKWLKSISEENLQQNIETNILVLQDVIPHHILRSTAWSKPDMVHIFIFTQNPTTNEEFATLRYGITELGATITEISKKYTDSERKGVIFLIDISILIHTFGARQAYNLILNKIRELRTSGTSLIAIIHQETHEEFVLALFRTIADEIIQL